MYVGLVFTPIYNFFVGHGRASDVNAVGHGRLRGVD